MKWRDKISSQKGNKSDTQSQKKYHLVYKNVSASLSTGLKLRRCEVFLLSLLLLLFDFSQQREDQFPAIFFVVDPFSSTKQKVTMFT